MNNFKKRIGSALISVALIMTMLPVLANAAEYHDISGHWAEAAIVRWSGYGVLKGSNGNFRPDDTVTRAELAALLNRMLKYPAQTEHTYTGLKSTDWFYNDVLSLATYDIVRSENKVIKPYEALTREEAAFMVGKAFGVKPYQILYKEFNDSADISSWAEPFVCAMYHYGFVNGMESDIFQPKGKVTRAQVVTMLNNMVDYYITEPGTHDITGSDTKVLVNCNGATLKFSSCSAVKLFISPGANDGTLEEKFYDCSTELTQTEFNVGMTSSSPMQTTVYPTIIFTDLSDTAINKGFAGGKGTPDDPYLIETQEQLEQLNSYIVGGYGYISSSYLYFKLMNDITLSGNWTPIADPSVEIRGRHVDGYFGELNGAGHTISYSIQADNSNVKNPGLFGGLCGLVRNLNVKASITGTRDCWSGIGGVAGTVTFNFTHLGMVQNCNADVTMNVSGKSISVGGIAGNSVGIISNCRAKVEINAVGKESTYAGGIVGYNNGKIYNCGSTGAVTSEGYAGGIAGFLEPNGDMKYCNSTAEVISKGGHITQAGGIAGDSN